MKKVKSYIKNDLGKKAKDSDLYSFTFEGINPPVYKAGTFHCEITGFKRRSSLGCHCLINLPEYYE